MTSPLGRGSPVQVVVRVRPLLVHEQTQQASLALGDVRNLLDCLKLSVGRAEQLCSDQTGDCRMVSSVPRKAM